MTPQLKRLAAAAGLAAACLVGLSGCGGGGGGSASTDDGLTQMEREDLAASSWPGMLIFAEGQIRTMTNETAEPRPIAGIKPPQSETDEPAAI